MKATGSPLCRLPSMDRTWGPPYDLTKGQLLKLAITLTTPVHSLNLKSQAITSPYV